MASRLSLWGICSDGGDVEKIEEQMKHLRAAKRSVKNGVKQLTPARALFTKELIFPDHYTEDKEMLLRELCARLESLGYVTHGFEASVLEREQHTSTEVGKRNWRFHMDIQSSHPVGCRVCKAGTANGMV